MPKNIIKKNIITEKSLESLKKKLIERKTKEKEESNVFTKKIKLKNLNYYKKLSYFLDIIYKNKFMEDKKITSLSAFIEDTILQRNLIKSNLITSDNYLKNGLNKPIIKKFIKLKIINIETGTLYKEIEKYANNKNKKLDNSFFENLKTNEFEEIIINSIKRANRNL
ncbi:MAG: hypothetical protein PHR26_03740 [Candidatus ainarchaeum sp.]|nr:hypothetical protein [Candidatus ainarchaeum sp.]MDD3976208.1 hypothetical protein [Candidatus ainarchaeum sp.]